MAQKRDFSFEVSIYRDNDVYRVMTEDIAAFNMVKIALDSKHILIVDESEVLDENKKPKKQYIFIRKRSDAKKLINILLNESWCYLHIDLN